MAPDQNRGARKSMLAVMVVLLLCIAASDAVDVGGHCSLQ